MKQKSAILLTVCIIMWIVPLLGKRWIPELFNNIYVQLTCAGIVAVCIGVGLVYNYFLLFSSANKSLSVYISICVFVIIYSINLATYSILFPLIMGIEMKDDTYDCQNISRKIEVVISSNDYSKRIDNARKLYVAYGIKVYYKNSENEITQYDPTKSDNDKRQIIIEGNGQHEIIKRTIKELYSQLPILSGIYIILVSISIIIATYAFRIKLVKDNNN